MTQEDIAREIEAGRDPKAVVNAHTAKGPKLPKSVATYRTLLGFLNRHGKTLDRDFEEIAGSSRDSVKAVEILSTSIPLLEDLYKAEKERMERQVRQMAEALERDGLAVKPRTLG